MTPDEYEKLSPEEREHFVKCSRCGKIFDRRSLDEVLFHHTNHQHRLGIQYGGSLRPLQATIVVLSFDGQCQVEPYGVLRFSLVDGDELERFNNSKSISDCHTDAAYTTMPLHLTPWLMAVFMLSPSLVFAGGFKTKVITTSPITIPVPDDRFIKITNFTQEGGTERAVVRVNLSGDSGGVANVLTAVRIDLSTGANAQNFPEINNKVVIAGPAEVTVAPVPGATLVITYKKDINEGAGEETPPPVVISPTPGGSVTPTVTPFPTFTPII